MFSDSTAPDITESLPMALTKAKAASQLYSPSGTRFDISIGGVPFFLDASKDDPYQRQTAPFQKDQVDTSKEAGEQTLDGYWIRSQTSWHRGSGIRYYEPGSDADTEYRYEESLGVDVWDRDKLTLLKKTTKVASVPAGECAVTGGIVSRADVLFVNANGTLQRYDATGGLVATYTGATDCVGPVALAGSKILAGHATGIVSGDASGSTLTGLWTQASGTAPTVYWAKSRIIATRGAAIYDLTMAGGNLDTATPLYTHPDPDWAWSSVAEGPSAIYASGYSNGYSVVYRFFLQDASSGSVPELSQAYQTTELPLGEEVRSIHVALGSFMALGTTRGLRIAAIASSGDLMVGPLLFTTDSPVQATASGDRFVYAAVQNGHPDGLSGAVRVDLSEPIGDLSQLRFPYAWDARCGAAGEVTSVALLGASSRVTMGLRLSGAYVQSATDYESTGWFRTGRIRYGTVEQKLFRSLSIGCQIPNGSVVVAAVDADGDENYLRTLTPASGAGDISLGSLPGGYEFLRFKLTLNSDAGTPASTPTMDSMQVRALPFVRRQRLIQYPLLCMDHELSPTGVQIGTEGYAIARLKGLEAVEEENVVVTVQDFTTDETFTGLIEQTSFKRPSPRSADGRKNFGGTVIVLVRKLA